ncbi:MAG: glycosyltransferase [candidate division WOR-3 bacterium]
MKEIWLIYSSEKGGHKYPASALAKYLKKEHPPLKPIVINLFRISRTLAFFDRIGRFGDLRLRFLWRASGKRLAEKKTLFPHLYRGILKLIIGLSHSKNFLLKKNRPALIISFQPELNICAPFFKRWFSCPFYSVVIDLLIHHLWVEKDVDRYYVPNEYVQEDLEKWGVPKEKIIIAGLPLREGFQKVKEEMSPEIKRKWQIPPDKPCLLLIGGLLGKMLNFDEVLQSLRKTKEKLSLILVCGENRQKRIAGEKLAHSLSSQSLTIISLGRVEEIYELMAIADIIITKPSSGTISEACALGKPLLLIPPAGGAYQDIRFAYFLKSIGAGIWVKEEKRVGEIVEKILKNRELFTNLRENAQKFGARNLSANKIIAESLMADYRLGRF